MHLVLLISSLNSGGAQRILSRMANYWAHQGHRVSLITFSSSKELPFYSLNPAIKLIQLDQMNGDSSIFTRFKNQVKRVFYLRRILKKLKPHLLVSFIDIMNITALIATLGLKIPVIVSERTHPAYHHIPFLYRKLRLLFYPKAAYVIVQTQDAGAYFKGLKNIRVLPNAVTKPSVTKNAFNPFPARLVSVGRLCPFKGFDMLIEAFSCLLKEYPSLTLEIYGDGAEREKLEERVALLQLEKHVYLRGVVKDIQSVLRQADLFIFPSRYEGFPNALCEAMAIGLPVIASDCSGNREIVQDRKNGRSFPSGDIQALICITRELLNDSEQCLRLGNEAKTICSKFSQEKIFGLWDQVIERITSRL